MTEDSKRRQVSEAIAAADYALSCLSRAGDDLRSARNWGIFDIAGGGLIATMIKRGKMKDAQRHMDEARSALQRFSRQSAALNDNFDLDLDSSALIAFSDYFFDGLIFDITVQSQIKKAQEQVDDAMIRVRQMRAQLVDMMEQV